MRVIHQLVLAALLYAALRLALLVLPPGLPLPAALPLPRLPEPVGAVWAGAVWAWAGVAGWWSWGGALQGLGVLALAALLLYAAPLALLQLLPAQNLRTKYKASWAFISGASSGLGRALAFKMASQGLNVVVCALPDAALEETMRDLQAAYPSRTFVRVGVNLGAIDSEEYMAPIRAATSGLGVQVVFSNAGYVVARAFAKTEMGRLAANWACNVTSHIHIAHHFFAALQRDHRPGCLVFTSSHVAFMPAPANALYGASKAALTALAANLALEGAPYGIDVAAVQVGPMRTPFVRNLAPLDAARFFYQFASTPEEVAEVLCGTVGRLAVRDHSLLGVALRLLFRVLDLNWYLALLAFALPRTADWRNFPDLH